VRSAKHGRTEAAAISSSVLAVGTPKYGRMDTHEPVGEQLHYDPKLFKAFDCVTEYYIDNDNHLDVLTNLPAVHSHTTSTELANRVFKAYRVVANTLDPDVPESINELLHQIELKVKELQPESGVLAASAVTASLLRGAKASARIRLRDSVCKDDIRRASVVLPWFLVGGDLSEIIEDPVGYTVGGDFDAEVVETGVSKQPANLKGVIAEVAEEYEKGAPIEVVLQRATDIGLDATKAEQEIEKLRRKGEVYEQHQDHLRTT
jgi:replicative DNA helicase Mcm